MMQTLPRIYSEVSGLCYTEISGPVTQQHRVWFKGHIMTSELQLKNKRVLIVDDLVEARSAMKSMMAMLGAENVETARDGREATDMITERDYDLVLSDYNLGKGKDGQQVPEMTDAVVNSISERYIELFENVTGDSFEKPLGTNPLERIESNINSYLTKG